MVVDYFAADSATNGARVAPTTSSTKGVVSTVDIASTSHIDSRIDPSDGTATVARYLSVRQASPSDMAKPVTVAAAATATGAADSWHPFDTGTTFDTGYGPCGRKTIAGSGQDDTVGATMAVTADIHTDAGRK